MPRDVAVVGYAKSSFEPVEDVNDVELVMPVVSEVLANLGLTIRDIGFTCSGSTDYLAGVPFSFVGALDGVGAWPPIEESHVEMDGAWALYEAWVRLQLGDIDTALVYCFGKSSLSTGLSELMSLQLDPYVMAPLWPDATALAALQARACLDAGRFSEDDMAAVAARSKGGGTPGDEQPYIVSPLRPRDCPPVNDGAAAIVLAAGETARRLHARPAWITGIDHRMETHSLGSRDLTKSPSVSMAAREAGAGPGARPIEIAELHAPYSHEELILRDALGLGGDVTVNPSGGALRANPVMVAGLARIGEAAGRVLAGEASRVLAHATSGPCLQQNLVCVMEGR